MNSISQTETYAASGTTHNGPLVTLVDFTDRPYDLSVASARTCYSGKGIVWPQDVSATEKSREIRDRIAASTLKAGHLTTRQHANFVFAIDRVSRHLVWSFLHSHPFYNSEQVSQRYVEVKTEQFYVPDSLRAPGREKLLDQYLGIIRACVRAYFELIEDLKVPARSEFFRIFPARARNTEKWEKSIHKKSMEAARYVLPVATYTYLYHTINGLTLHRYRRLCQSFDVPVETSMLVDAMFHAVRDADPMFTGEIQDPIPLEETPEYAFFEGLRRHDDSDRRMALEFTGEFDSALGGKTSRLAAFSGQSVHILAESVRSITGRPQKDLSDLEAIDLLMNPAKNPHLSSTLNEMSLSRISRALTSVQYTFQKKISHTADSQDQRHRMVPGGRPLLIRQFSGKPDFITPAIIRSYGAVNDKYAAVMEKLFEEICEFQDAGGTPEESVYLLPNAFPVRFYESGDLLGLFHKWKIRTCYNAQEEIFRASVEELEQVHQIHPEIGKWIKAPCWVRKQAGVKPFCPEGDKFCGVSVWNQELPDYLRIL